VLNLEGMGETQETLWRLAEYRAAHPRVQVGPPVDGVWHAWIPLQGGGPKDGTAVSRDTLELLLDRLEQLG